ncbi:hypothetical protein RQP46_006891 [Phenoliferia psychrophenolica]
MIMLGDSFSTSGWRVSEGPLSPDTTLTTSNGPNWVDFLTNHLVKNNETASSSLSILKKGEVYVRNFAVSGATIANEFVSYPFHQRPLKVQVESFLETFASEPRVLPWKSESTLFASFIGINDVGLSFERDDQTLFHELEFAAWTKMQENFYAAGARHFLHISVHPIDRAPMYSGKANNDQLKAAIVDYNTQLRTSSLKFQSAHPDAVVMLYDAHKAFTKLLDNAQSLGFKNVTSSCDAYGPTTPPTKFLSACINPVEEYFWIDRYHPTSKVHRLFSEGVQEFLQTPVAVTESASVKQPDYVGVVLQDHARRKLRVAFGSAT